MTIEEEREEEFTTALMNLVKDAPLSILCRQGHLFAAAAACVDSLMLLNKEHRVATRQEMITAFETVLDNIGRGAG